MNESKKLRRAGANAVLIVGHLGNFCNITNKFGFWTKDTQQADCGDFGEVSKLLTALPAGTVDGIIQGHAHKFAHHFINGIFLYM